MINSRDSAKAGLSNIPQPPNKSFSEKIFEFLTIAALLYLYIMTFILGVVTDIADFGDGCGVNNCKFYENGLQIAPFWLILSFIYISNWISNKNRTRGIIFHIFMPYTAIPIFVFILMIATYLDIHAN